MYLASGDPLVAHQQVPIPGRSLALSEQSRSTARVLARSVSGRIQNGARAVGAARSFATGAKQGHDVVESVAALKRSSFADDGIELVLRRKDARLGQQFREPLTSE